MGQKNISIVLERVERIAQEVVAPSAREIDAEGRWPEQGVRALLDAGLGGLVVPEAHGGLGFGLEALARVCEILGRACASTAICYGMHCVGSAVIAAKATPPQQKGLLEPIVRGQHLTTLALSESGTGSHFYLPESALVSVPGGYRVSGQKSFVTNGGHADSYVVSTRASAPSAGPGDFSCVVVPADAPGLVWGPAWQGAGMRGNSARNVELREVPLSTDALLGQEGDEIWFVFHVIAPYFLVAMSGTYLGVLDAAFDEAKDHLTSRRHSHTAVALSQEGVLQHRLGVLWAAMARTRQFVYAAAQEHDAGSPTGLAAVCSAKAEVADAATFVINEALTLVGGKGYSEASSPLLRHLRDARAAHVMSPTTDMLRRWTGRAILGLPLLGD